VHKLLADYMAQYPRRRSSSYSPPWEPVISPSDIQLATEWAGDRDGFAARRPPVLSQVSATFFNPFRQVLDKLLRQPTTTSFFHFIHPSQSSRSVQSTPSRHIYLRSI
jgi:hypothetical protein